MEDVMKKYTGICVFAFFLAANLWAQNSPASPETARVKGQYYEILSEGDVVDAAALVKELELRMGEYNRLFHFDPSLISAPLQVRVFRNKAGYDAYVSARLGRTRDGAVYLHYNQAERRELIVHRGSPEEGRLLSHQAFIQYLRAFIPNPPAWMREGFAIYFNTLGFDAQRGELQYEENLAWLETVKSLGNQAPSLRSVLLADAEGIPDHFQSVSWALVSFLLNSGGETYFRALTEAFMVLSPTASATENGDAVMKRLSLWVDPDTLSADYRAYLISRKTFAELLEAGQRAYGAKDPVSAELNFISALNQRPAHYAPYYYLGLLAYEERNYDMAEQYYRSAIQYGADPALVRYALGLNAASAGRTVEAIDYLEQAAAASPERYRTRVESLIRRLR
jgi:tetratricopeptide (TPR) repeat protein